MKSQLKFYLTSCTKSPGNAFALLIYGLVLLVSIVLFVAQPSRSVSMHYELAAIHWLDGDSLYAFSMERGHGFLYLPQAAILHIPYALLTQLTGLPLAGDIAWRAASWIVFVFAMWRMGRQLKVSTGNAQWRIALVACMLAASSLKIGQSTVIMTALMLLSVEMWQAKRLMLASVLIALAVAFKPLALVLALILLALVPQMRKPLLFACATALMIPFLLQHPSYVLQQYQDCVAMLRVSADAGTVIPGAHLFGLLQAFGISVSYETQTVYRVVASFVTLGLAWFSVRWAQGDRVAAMVFAWSAVYLMLFNPRTENSTYCLLAPVIAYFVAEAATIRENHLVAWLIFGLAVLTAGSYEIGRLIIPASTSTTWLAPMSCVMLVAFLLVEVYRDRCSFQRVIGLQTTV